MSKTLNDFYNDLGARESGGDYTVVNRWGYVGKYQMGESAMVDAGYYIKPSRNYNNDWTGQFTGKDGVYSLDDFRKNKQAQENAQKSFKQAQWHQLKSLGLDKYVGKEINGVKITQSGLLAAAHLKGPRNVQKYLESSGKDIPKDKLGTSVEDYMSKFGGYDVSEITGLKIDAMSPNAVDSSTQYPNITNISKYSTSMDISPFQVGIEYNEYLPGYLPSFDNLFINPVDNTVLPTNVQKMPDFSDIPFANPLANQGQSTGFAAPMPQSQIQQPKIFTPEDIGNMTREEFDKNEKFINEQLQQGLIAPTTQRKQNYSGYRNPVSGDNRIFSQEDIGDFSGDEFAKHEKEIRGQWGSIGIPTNNELQSSGAIYIAPYTRSDGVQVKGHYRSR